VVKWFKTEKGFGFVELSDGTGDAFLHASVLGRLGVTALRIATRSQNTAAIAHQSAGRDSTSAAARPKRAINRLGVLPGPERRCARASWCPSERR